MSKFTPGGITRFNIVQSRMVLWATSGRGKVEINGHHFSLIPGIFLIIPWMHKINYRADINEPFHLAGIHLIPDYRGKPPFQFQINHLKEVGSIPENENYDHFIPGLEDIFYGEFRDHSGLNEFLLYIIYAYRRSSFTESKSNFLARLLIDELSAVANNKIEKKTPLRLETLLVLIQKNLTQNISVESLALTAGIHPSVEAVNLILESQFPKNEREYITDDL